MGSTSGRALGGGSTVVRGSVTAVMVVYLTLCPHVSATRNTPRSPLTARSLIASLLLGLDPPSATAQFVVRSNEMFGVNEGTTRTALSRMVAAHELPRPTGATS